MNEHTPLAQDLDVDCGVRDNVRTGWHFLCTLYVNQTTAWYKLTPLGQLVAFNCVTVVLVQMVQLDHYVSL